MIDRTPSPRRGDRIDVVVEDLDDDGLGRAAMQGRSPPVRLEDALPGEAGTALVIHAGRNVTAARLVARTRDSAERRAPLPCPRWTSASPCRLMHLVPAAQARFKADRVRRALAGAGIDPARVTAADSSGPEFGWRSRATYVVARRGSGIVLGAFRRGTHHVQPMLGCPLESVGVAETARAVREALEVTRAPIAGRYLVIDDGGCGAPPTVAALEREVRGGRREPGDPPRGRGVEYLDVRADPSGHAVVTLVTDDGTLDGEDAVLAALRERSEADVWFARRGPGDVLVAADSLRPTGSPRPLRFESDGLVFDVSPGSFFQIHWGAACGLHRRAAELAVGAAVLDVFAGVGAIALRVARGGARVTAVEASPRAVEDARRNATLAGLGDRVTVIRGDARAALAELAARSAFDSVVLNPPRRGCGDAVVDAVIALAPARVVYVSCHPASFARDAVRLSTEYELREVAVHDLFPHSEHVELVAHFDRR